MVRELETILAATDPQPIVVQGSDGTNLYILKTDANGNLVISGAAAAQADVSGNPVYVGGIVDNTKPLRTNGKVAAFSFGLRNSLQVEVFGADSQVGAAAGAFSADAQVAANANGIFVKAHMALFNGSTVDRVRSIVDATDSVGTGIQAAGLVAQLDDTSPTTITENQFGNVRMAANRALLVKPYASPAQDWTYAAATSGISNSTTAVTIAAAAGAGIRNYITAIQIAAEALGAATELAIRDGAGGTVLWRTKIGTAGIVNGISIPFPTPLKSTANTLLEVVTLTASVTGAVFFNAQGYTAP